MSTKTEAIVKWMGGTTARVPAETAVVVVRVVRGVIPPEFISVADGVPTLGPWGKTSELTTMSDAVGSPCGPMRTMSSHQLRPAIYVDTGQHTDGFSRVSAIYRRITHSEWPAEQNP